MYAVSSRTSQVDVLMLDNDDDDDDDDDNEIFVVVYGLECLLTALLTNKLHPQCPTTTTMMLFLMQRLC